MGYTIVQFRSGGKWLYFICYKFTEGYFNSTASIEYNVVEGINITNFLETRGIEAPNPSAFSASLNAEIERLSVVRCQFPKTTEYLKWQIVK